MKTQTRPAKNVGEQLEAVKKNVHVKNFERVLHCREYGLYTCHMHAQIKRQNYF